MFCLIALLAASSEEPLEVFWPTARSLTYAGEVSPLRTVYSPFATTQPVARTAKASPPRRVKDQRVMAAVSLSENRAVMIITSAYGLHPVVTVLVQRNPPQYRVVRGDEPKSMARLDDASLVYLDEDRQLRMRMDFSVSAAPVASKENALNLWWGESLSLDFAGDAKVHISSEPLPAAARVRALAFTRGARLLLPGDGQLWTWDNQQLLPVSALDTQVAANGFAALSENDFYAVSFDHTLMHNTRVVRRIDEDARALAIPEFDRAHAYITGARVIKRYGFGADATPETWLAFRGEALGRTCFHLEHSAILSADAIVLVLRCATGPSTAVIIERTRYRTLPAFDPDLLAPLSDASGVIGESRQTLTSLTWDAP
jgi:hypothetical protein